MLPKTLKSVFFALPSAAASCTPLRLSIIVSVVEASLVFRLPATAPITPRLRDRPARPPPMPPVFWLKVISGFIV